MATSEAIRVLLVDDQKSTVELLKSHLSGAANIDVVGTAYNGQEAIEQVQEIEPDVLLIDIEMPGIDGLTAMRMIAQCAPNTGAIVLSSHDNEDYLQRALRVGARGYVLKATPARELADAVRAVHKGYYYVGPILLDRVIQVYLQANRAIADVSEKQQENANGAAANALREQQKDFADDLVRTIKGDFESVTELLQMLGTQQGTLEHLLNRNDIGRISQQLRGTYAQVAALERRLARIDNLLNLLVTFVGIAAVVALIARLTTVP